MEDDTLSIFIRKSAIAEIYSKRYDKISDSGRSANPTLILNATYINFISLTELLSYVVSANRLNCFKSRLYKKNINVFIKQRKIHTSVPVGWKSSSSKLVRKIW